ncbi:MAG: PfkB family carbohydrate kinase [Chloroflexota bacterium]
MIGSASRDLTPDDPRGWRLGGAAAYTGLVLARLGLRPRVLLGVDGPASAAEELQWLRDAGADLRLHPLVEGPVFTNRDTPDGRVQTCATPGVPLPTNAVPEDWLTSSAWCLVPVADEIDDAWAEVPPDDALVVVGWQGLLRTLPRGGNVRRRAAREAALLRRAALVGLSREDIAPGVLDADLLRLLRPPVMLAITAGSNGGVAILVDGGGHRRVRNYPAIPADAAVDATGAGDAFLAGLLAARLGHPLAGSGRRGSDLRLAAALGSLVVERPGLLGVPTLAAVAERMRRSLKTCVTPDGPAGSPV